VLDAVVVQCDGCVKDAGTPPHAEKTSVVAGFESGEGIVLDPAQVRLAGSCVDRLDFLKALGIDYPAPFTPERFERAAECGEVVEKDTLESLAILGASATSIACLLQDTSSSKSFPGRQFAGT
jgi:hypothetical protein